MARTDQASRVIDASPERIYRAFTDPDMLTKWLPPVGMTGRFERFDAGVHGTTLFLFPYAQLPVGPGGHLRQVRHRQHLARIQPQPRRRTMHRGQHRRKQQCHHRSGRIHHPCTGCRQRQQQTGQGCRPQCQRSQRLVCRALRATSVMPFL